MERSRSDADTGADAARRRAAMIGAGSLAIGVALLVSPGELGRTVGLDPRAARLIALADLALGPGLLAGRPRSPWVLARAALNVPIAACLTRSGTTAGRLGAGALAGVTVADLRLARELRVAGA